MNKEFIKEFVEIKKEYDGRIIGLLRKHGCSFEDISNSMDIPESVCRKLVE